MSVVFPLSEPYVSYILEFVGCQYHLSLPVTDITPNIFFTSSMKFCETVTGQFLYTRLAITGSLTRVETNKGSERVFGLTLNWTTILSYKRQSHVCCLSTEWTICESHHWVCRMPISPVTTRYLHHTNFLDLINFSGSLKTCNLKNFSRIILTKSQTLAGTYRSFLLVGTKIADCSGWSYSEPKAELVFWNSAFELSYLVLEELS